MIRIGAITIDTSHPLAFAKLLAEDKRAKYVGVYDDSFRSDAEVEGFVKNFGLEKRCSSLAELADLVDIGFIHSCDWDRHLDYALPFIEKGKPVFIDKPIVGNLQDCQKLTELAQAGAVILGSSSVRYAHEIVQFAEQSASERGEIISVFGTSGVDEFNYGIHVVEGICGLVQKPAVAVKFIGRGSRDGKTSESFYIDFGDGQNAIYNTFMGTWQPFAYTIMTTSKTFQFTVDTGKIYAALLDEIFAHLAGQPSRIVSVNDLADSVKIMLAARISRAQGGTLIKLDEIPLTDPGYDGAEFYAGYSAAAKPMYL